MVEARAVLSPQERQPKFPKIEYRDSVLSPDCPYQIHVEPEAAGSLLRLAGVPEDHIEGVTIIIDRKRKHRSTLMGQYNSKERSITLYGDFFWNRQRKIIRRAEDMLAEREKQGETNSQQSNSPHQGGFPDTSTERNKFRKLSSGKHLSWYLTVAPPDRARAMVKKLAAINAQREISSMLQHESKHAGDLLGGEHNHPRREVLPGYLMLIVEGIIGMNIYLSAESSGVPPLVLLAFRLVGSYYMADLGATIAYLLDPFEIRARKFQRELQHDPRQHVVTITPKPKA